MQLTIANIPIQWHYSFADYSDDVSSGLVQRHEPKGKLVC